MGDENLKMEPAPGSPPPGADAHQEVFPCEYCGFPMVLAPGIDYYCNNKDCPELKLPREERMRRCLERLVNAFGGSPKNPNHAAATWGLRRSGYRMTGDSSGGGRYWRSPDGRQMSYREALEEVAAERSGAPEASSPKGPTNVTTALPKGADGERKGGGAA